MVDIARTTGDIGKMKLNFFLMSPGKLYSMLNMTRCSLHTCNLYWLSSSVCEAWESRTRQNDISLYISGYLNLQYFKVSSFPSMARQEIIRSQRFVIHPFTLVP